MSISMTREELGHFENLIHLPLVLAVLKQDRERIALLPFKFSRPYQDLVDAAINSAEVDCKLSKIYITKRDHKLYKIEQKDSSTIYLFLCRGQEERREYPHDNLKSRTEKLMAVYLHQGTNENT